MGISASYDREQLVNLLAAQYDVVTRRQLLDCGMTRSAIQYRVKPDGDWKLILPGVYSAHSGPVRAAAREVAALLYAGPGALLTGAFAVRRLGLVATGPDSIEILVPPNVRRQSIRFVRLIHTTRMPSATVQAGPILMAPPARAVADAEELGAELREGPPELLGRRINCAVGAL